MFHMNNLIEYCKCKFFHNIFINEHFFIFLKFIIYFILCNFIWCKSFLNNKFLIKLLYFLQSILDIIIYKPNKTKKYKKYKT